MNQCSFSRKQRAFRGLPLILLTLVLFLSIGKTVDDLRRSLKRAFVQRERVWAAWGTPWSGEDEVLPPPVNEALAMMRPRVVTAYALSPGWSTERFPLQRLVEGAFPARPLARADYYVGIVGEDVPSSCQKLEERAEVFLAACR